MNVREELYRLFCSPKCVSCEKALSGGEDVLCEECMNLFRDETIRDCSFCFNKISECTCTPKSFKNNRIKLLFKISRYNSGCDNSPTKKLVFSLKHDNFTSVFNFIARILSNRLHDFFKEEVRDLVLIPIPRRSKNIIKYGYDHAFELSKRMSKILECKVLPILKSYAKKDQKALTQQERAENAHFRLKKRINLEGKTVVMIDDIVTSGASMMNAAQLIRELKPSKIIGSCFAISYRDIDLNVNIPF